MKILHVVIVLVAMSLTNCDQSNETHKPNIILIMADDLGYNDVSSYRSLHTIDYENPPTSQTPAIDKLADEGMLFTDFYSGSPVCSPSRGALLTGRNSNRLGIYNWIPPGSPMHLRSDEITIGEVLKQTGYDTAHFGKWHLTSEGMGQPLPNDQGYDYSFYTYNNASPNHRNPDNFYKNDTPLGELEGYAAQLVVDEAIQWIETTREKDKPFYINVWFNEPHTPLAAPDELVDRHEYRGEYYGAIENMDKEIKKLTDYLQYSGLESETIVIFTSDNGSQWPNSNKPLYGAKHFTYEGGIRVPFIIRWPEFVEEGIVTDITGSFTDLLPTLTELTGTNTPNDRILDGESLLQVINDPHIDFKRHKPIFHYRYFHDPILMLREDNWVLLGYDELVPREDHLMANELDKIEPWRFEKNHMEYLEDLKPSYFKLYNLENDLGQEINLADDYPEIVERMKHIMLKLQSEMIMEGGNWFEDN